MTTQNVNKARTKIKSLIHRAVLQRDRHGYHENLGYEQVHQLENYMAGLDLSYSEYCSLITDFNRQCDAL